MTVFRLAGDSNFGLGESFTTQLNDLDALGGKMPLQCSPWEIRPLFTTGAKRIALDTHSKPRYHLQN